jgi:hypothetical protein
MDAQYLRDSVGESLQAGLSKVAAVQPADPCSYLGNFLLKFVSLRL